MFSSLANSAEGHRTAFCASAPALAAHACVASLWLNPFAPGPSPAAASWLGAAVLLGAAWGFLIVGKRRRLVGPPGWYGAIAAAWLVAALLSSAVALVQYFGLSHHLVPLISKADVGEAYGNLRQRNQLATLTNIGVAALLWLQAERWGRAESAPIWCRWLLTVAALTLLLVGQAATGSRIGFSQLVLLVVLATLWRSQWRANVTGFCLGALGCYVVAALALPRLLMWSSGALAPHVFARLAHREGCEGRRVLWANVLRLIAEKPWTGWGWGELDYAHYATLYEGERFCDILDNAHNLPLHLAVELGIPVAVAVCTAVCWLVYRGSPWREVDPMRRLAWAVLAIIGLHSLVEYPLWYAPFLTAAGLCVCFLMGPPLPQRREAQPRWLLMTRWLLAFALTATVLHAWRDYNVVSQLYLPVEQRSPSMRQNREHELDKLVWFRETRDFALLTTTPLTVANAASMAALAARLLHYSPEPRVVEVLVESLMLLKREDDALWHLARFQAAFPTEFKDWQRRNQAPPHTKSPAASAREKAS